jgi:hypothetical protein
MADWKQITARIRRARTGKDPAGQLTSLFSKTRDAMVAFELARYFETNGNTADAGRWYLTAAERFRRADWKSKAQESATRLGATEPAEIPVAPVLTANRLTRLRSESPRMPSRKGPKWRIRVRSRPPKLQARLAPKNIGTGAGAAGVETDTPQSMSHELRSPPPRVP